MELLDIHQYISNTKKILQNPDMFMNTDKACHFQIINSNLNRNFKIALIMK